MYITCSGLELHPLLNQKEILTFEELFQAEMTNICWIQLKCKHMLSSFVMINEGFWGFRQFFWTNRSTEDATLSSEKLC